MTLLKNSMCLCCVLTKCSTQHFSLFPTVTIIIWAYKLQESTQVTAKVALPDPQSIASVNLRNYSVNVLDLATPVFFFLLEK